MSSLLCCCLLFSALSLNASAADGTDGPLIASELEYTCTDWYIVDDSPVESDISSLVTVYDVPEGIFKDYTRYTIPFNTSRYTLQLDLIEDFNLNSTHEYNIAFNWAYSVGNSCVVGVVLKYYDNNGNLLKEQELVVQEGTGLSSTTLNSHSIDIDFKPDVSGISGGYSCDLVISFAQFGSTQVNSPSFLISDDIVFEDKDDDSGWFQKILNAIKAIPDNIKSFFTNLGDRISGFFDELGAKIVDGFENLKLKFEEFKESVAELGENILEGLKSLFIPGDGYFELYFDEFDTWAKARFGFLYTLGDMLSDLVDILKGLMTDDYSFTLPAARFNLNGTQYTLWEEYTFDMKSLINNNSQVDGVKPIARMYNIYLVILRGGIAFLLFKYAQKVYDKILAN